MVYGKVKYKEINKLLQESRRFKNALGFDAVVA